MSHMVIYRKLDGKPGFEQSDSLDQAIRFVERLRNDDGVESARIYRLEQVEFSFEPFFRVRVDGSDSGATTAPVTGFGSSEPSSFGGSTATPRPATPGSSEFERGTFGANRDLPPRPEPMAGEGVSSARPPTPPDSGPGSAPTDAVGDTSRLVGDAASDIGPDGDEVRRGLFGR